MATVNNMEVEGLYNRLNRFIFELYKSGSSSLGGMEEGDIGRLRTYLDAIDKLHTHILDDPKVEFPETHPQEYTLRDPAAIDVVENEDINDLLKYLVATRGALVNSASARQAVGLDEFTSARLTNNIQKSRNFLDNYIVDATPLDLPESSPRVNDSGSGRKGINPK